MSRRYFCIRYVSCYHIGVGVRIAFVLTRRGNAKTWRSGMKQCIKPTLFVYIPNLELITALFGLNTATFKYEYEDKSGCIVVDVLPWMLGCSLVLFRKKYQRSCLPLHRSYWFILCLSIDYYRIIIIDRLYYSHF